MASSVLLKRSAVASKVPLTTDLALGEIAINTYDGKLFIKKDNGTQSIVEIGAGGGGGATDLSFSANGSTVSINSNTGADIVIPGANSSVAGFLTAEAQTIGGIKTFSANSVFSTQVKLGGTSGAMTVGHTGTYGFLLNTTGGTDISGSGINLIAGDGSITHATFSAAGGAQLRFNDVVRIQTTSTGATVTGNIVVTGTVDGRDVSVDGTKLDGIEAGATADMTAAEILTAVKTVDGAGSGLDADLLDGLNPATAPTPSTIVSRDASSNFSANTITAALAGNASTATTLQTTRTLWGQNFNGSGNVNGILTNGTWNGNTIDIAYGGTGQTIGPVAYTSLRGYLGVTAGVNQTLTSSSPNLINVIGTAATTIDLPDVTTLTLGRSFVIRNSMGGFAVTVRTSTLAAVLTIAANSEVRLIAVSTSDNSAAGWAGYFTGFSGTSGSGNVVRATSPSISGLTLTGTLNANSSVGSAGQVLTSTGTGIYWANAASGPAGVVSVSDTAPSSPSSGDLWFDSTDASFNIYYNDGTSSQWINAVNNQNDPVFRVKTANYTASNRDQIIADTSAGSFTITLPASPISGTAVTIFDNASWGVNNLTIARNGSTIEGIADDFVLDVSSIKVEFIYNGSTWQVYSSIGQSGAAAPTVTTSDVIALAIALG